MKAQIDKVKSSFNPVIISITIETKDELEILHRYFNVDTNKQVGMINDSLVTKFNHQQVRSALDPIYEAIENSF